MRLFFKILIAFIVLIAVVGGSLYLWYANQEALPKKEAVVKIEENDSVSDIAQKLKAEKIIRNSIPFYIAYSIIGKDHVVPGGYVVSTEMTTKQIAQVFEGKPYAMYVTLDPDMTKVEIGERIGEALGWGAQDRQYFSNTYAGMQWQTYQDFVQTIFPDAYKWNKVKTQTFLSISSLFHDDEKDFFKHMYIPGTYEIRLDASRAQVAGFLIDQFVEAYPDAQAALEEFLDKSAMNNVASLIEKEMILMPDIVAIPPHDITLKKQGASTFILFTTAYWNKGTGPLELVADPKTKGIRSDVDRNVYQRIYHLDGDYTERLSGRFLWHQPHLHYHFEDFAIYYLEPVDVPDMKEKLSFKSTFCVRDTEPIDLSHPGANKDAGYKICGKERQGISPGWADSYFYTYVDQRFNISNYPAGTYRLKVWINPKDRFDEITKDNNVGETLIYLDIKNNTVKVLKEETHGL